MIERYSVPAVTEIWSDQNKVAKWDQVELAAIEADVQLWACTPEAHDAILAALTENPCDLEWWKAREKETHHDLQAYVDERRRHIPEEYHQYFHRAMTSYDTEESAFVLRLQESVHLVGKRVDNLVKALSRRAKEERYQLMIGRTHGQPAELQTFGKRLHTWAMEVVVASNLFTESYLNVLGYSRLAGAIGNYNGTSIQRERIALDKFDREPLYGTTQIMPRALYTPIASGLANIGRVINSIAIDIRLGARGSRPIYQEPFGKKQKGSSAMPHKRNTILCENIAGLSELLDGYMIALNKTVVTWEERAIEQSSIERVAWPDMFHLAIFALDRMTKVIDGLFIHRANMLAEIVDTRGCYASNEAKNWLAEDEFTPEEAYSIVQLAAFNIHQVYLVHLPTSFEESAAQLEIEEEVGQPATPKPHLREVIQSGSLQVDPSLEVTAELVNDWNTRLRQLFDGQKTVDNWHKVFSPVTLLANDSELFELVENQISEFLDDESREPQ